MTVDAGELASLSKLTFKRNLVARRAVYDHLLVLMCDTVSTCINEEEYSFVVLTRQHMELCLQVVDFAFEFLT